MAAADLEGLCNSICRSSPAETLHLNRIVVQFILVSAADDATDHALIIQLSHCQHDGISIPILLDDLAAAYEGASLPSRSQFVDYCCLRAQQGVPKDYDLWRNYLSGASMTYLGNLQGPLLVYVVFSIARPEFRKFASAICPLISTVSMHHSSNAFLMKSAN